MPLPLLPVVLVMLTFFVMLYWVEFRQAGKDFRMLPVLGLVGSPIIGPHFLASSQVAAASLVWPVAFLTIGITVFSGAFARRN